MVESDALRIYKLGSGLENSFVNCTESVRKGIQSGFWAARSNLCPAGVSVMSNVAEGFARKGDRDFARFLAVARGSAVEVQALLYVAMDAVGLTRPSLTNCITPRMRSSQ